MPWYMWIALVMFIIGLLYTFVQLGITSGNSEKKAEMTKAIGLTTMVNSILTLVLAGSAYFYITSNELAERPYVMVMIHLSILLSIISVSVSSLKFVTV